MIDDINHIRYYTAEEVNAVINKLEQPAVIIGNGLNAEAGVFRGGWATILQQIAQRLDSRIDERLQGNGPLESFVVRILNDPSSNSVSLTELYDWLLIKYERLMISKKGFFKTKKESYSSKDKVNQELISTVIEESNKPYDDTGMSTFIHWCLCKNADIISANYDDCLLKAPVVDCKAKYKNWGKDEKAQEDTKAFPVFHSFLLQDRDEKTRECHLWCLNGNTKLENSPRLALRDYVNYAKFIKDNQLIFDKDKHTWIRQFVDKPLVFAGISMDSQEVILRMLLIERMRYHLITEKSYPPPSYYVQFNRKGVRAMDEVKREFLKDFGVIVLELQDGEKLSDCFKSVSTS